VSRIPAVLLAGALLAPAIAVASGEEALWRAYEERKPERAPATAHRDAQGKPRFVNELVRSRSPYLRDNAHSPVKWVAWDEDALPKGRSPDRLVFVSIGYSTCHWCHVMARESFDDLGVAALLNRAFTSVKVDSEERPDLDERFLARLEVLGISPGWPMNFVLTPEGELLWGATYVGRDELLATLGRLAERWESDRVRLQRLAAARERQVMPAVPPTDATRSRGGAYDRLASRLAADYDPVHKGFGTGRKFHAAAELGFLYDAWLRGADAQYGRMIVETARAIASGGLHDAIDGGVFRYSTTRDWLTPHFEKMLHDQAQAARLMCRAHGIALDASLGRAARGILDFALAAFTTREGLLASSFDAESDGVEGGYYLWSPAELESLPAKDREEVASRFQSVSLGGRTLLVPRAPDAGLASGKALDALRALRKTKVAPRRDQKAITAWNANFIAAMAECGVRLDEPLYAQGAGKRMRRLLELNVPAGRVHRYSVAGEAAGAGTMDDIGWLLAALAALHDGDGADEWITQAARLLGALAGADEAALAVSLGDFTRDRAGPSASAVLLDAASRLSRRSESAIFRASRDRVARLLGDRAGADGFASLTAALREVESPAPRPVVHAAQGKVRLSVFRDPAPSTPARFTVRADIRPGWHINSHEPGPEYLRPTRITVAGQAGFEVDAPRATPLRFIPTGDILSVLEGSPCFGVLMPLPGEAEAPVPVKVLATIQACNDRVCLRPETVELAGAPLRPSHCAR
jgi:hypothetical protein